MRTSSIYPVVDVFDKFFPRKKVGCANVPLQIMQFNHSLFFRIVVKPTPMIHFIEHLAAHFTRYIKGLEEEKKLKEQ